MQPEASPTLQAGGQPGEVEAVQVEDNLQCLPAALNVVEDVGICGGGGKAGGSLRGQGGAQAYLHQCSTEPPSSEAKVALKRANLILPTLFTHRDSLRPSYLPSLRVVCWDLYVSDYLRPLRPPRFSIPEGQPHCPSS